MRTIGSYTQPTTTVYRSHGETACNYSDIEVIAGTTVEVRGDDRSCYLTLPGTRVFRTNTNRLLHHSHTTQDTTRVPAAYSMHFYRYQLDALAKVGVVTLF